jgi:lipid-A-disaccharide synthase
VLLILPFEKAYYDEAGVPATYVGHPLADMLPVEIDRNEAKTALQIRRGTPTIALLPGSRFSEVEYLSELMVETAKILHEKYPEAQFLVPFVTRETKDFFVKTQYACKGGQLPIRIMFGHAHDAMKAADVTILASGTATLEALLLKNPMVITYKINNSTYRVVKKKFYLPYFGLPNIISGRFVVPEFMQAEAIPENLAQATSNYLSDPRLCGYLQDHFTDIHKTLRCDAATRAAKTVLAVMRQPA